MFQFTFDPGQILYRYCDSFKEAHAIVGKLGGKLGGVEIQKEGMFLFIPLKTEQTEHGALTQLSENGFGVEKI